MASAFAEIGHCRLIDLTAKMAESIDIANLCEKIAWDEDARAVLICFDNEVNELLETGLEPGGLSVLEPVAKLKQPVIAAIQGNAIGIGLELALACDIRIGSANASFGLNQIQEGRIPSSGGTQRLPRLVGQAKAMQMILTGESIEAAEACRIGLIHRAVALESVMNTALDVAQEIAARSPLSLSYVKEALYSGRDLTLDQGLKMELDLYLLLFSTFDRTEGVNAFREKRKPEFRGN
jgi:enoyl-CoA hydratase/carnithine racemase